MTFADIPAGASIFIDANTLVYHFAPDPQFGIAATSLLKRVEQNDIIGITSTHVLCDVAHRLMTLEAASQFGWSMARIAQRLRRNRGQIAKLTRFRQAVDEVPRLGVRVVPVTEAEALAAPAISQQHELLTGDALIIATMQGHGLSSIASNDDDFDRISTVVRYSPA